MKKIILSLIVAMGLLNLQAQDAGAPAEAAKDTVWTFGGMGSLNMSQLSLTNWAAGGDNSIAGNALVKLSASYAKDKSTWDNNLTLGFGLLKTGSDLARKSDDQIELSSIYGHKAGEGKWYYSALLNFRTQFAAGYDDPGDVNRMIISNFMSPAYLNLSLGMDYKPNDAFSLFLSPLSTKHTFVMDQALSDAGSFGVDPGKMYRGEFGGNIQMKFVKEVLKNVTIDTKLELFSNYLNNPQYVDVNWDMLITFKVNEYISASLLTSLIYDYDIMKDIVDETTGEVIGQESWGLQFKELFGLGLAYSF